MNVLDAQISIVILNYLNYQDTINCVESIFACGFKLCGIVVVDNGSKNESYEVLNKRYAENSNVYLLSAKKNLGFAKGNNIGIKFAREKLHSEFVFCCNNDIIFNDTDYFVKLLNHYSLNVGIIGSAIVNANNVLQPEFVLNIGFKALVTSYLNCYGYLNGANFELPTDEFKYQRIIHGCALLFTPAFFYYYKGFYKRTFLYYEEPILFFMCKEKGLIQVYVEDTSIKHLEDKSSEMSFLNDIEVMRKYSFKSMKYLVYWSFRDLIWCSLKKNKKGCKVK